MRIYFAIILLILSSIQVFAQDPNGGYHNLEKYWWYRYKLVNDFMKIGPECGGSIPAQRRTWVYGLNTDGTRKKGVLKFDDATLDIGNYIAMLATEYKLLKNNTFSTERTRMELHYALNAFERIDRNAEAYCTDIDGTYPCNPGNADPRGGGLNGFFIRDDVPQEFTAYNSNHFNREGVKPINPTNSWVDAGAIITRHSEYVASPPKVWGHGVLRMPWEESKDQVVQMAMGLSLAAKLVPDSYIAGSDIGVRSLNNLERMISFINTGFGGSHTNWKIINPVTDECVYGIHPDHPSCANGGAIFWDISYGAATGLVNVGGNPMIMVDASMNSLTWQLLQNVTKHQDLGFWGTFGALADNWIGPRVGRQTFHKLKKIAEAYDGGNQHLPYLYRVIHPGKGEWYNIAETRKLLDAAPPCGIHNYNGVWSITGQPGGAPGVNINPPNSHHWSGNDLIHEHYKRHATDVSSDCNGLDYMALFNLYSIQDPDYIKYMFNSFYREDYTEDFPRFYPPMSMQIGTHTIKLRLNFLQYLSSRNVVHPDGDLTFRGGKVIDLIPGFNTEYGGNFLAYVEDYVIDCGDIRRPGQNSYAGGAYHYADIWGKKSDLFPSGINPQYYGDGDTTIILDESPDGASYTPDSAAIVIGEQESILTCEEEHAYFDSLAALIYASGDTDQIAYLDTFIIPNTHFSACDSINNPVTTSRMAGSDQSSSEESNMFKVYPNPNDGHFTIVFNSLGEYDMQLLNAVGVVVYKSQIMNKRSETVNAIDFPSGIYTAVVSNRSGPLNRQLKKIIITH